MDNERGPNATLAKLILAAVVLALLTAFFPNPVQDAVVTAAIVEEVTARACISQAGPGQLLPKPVCALGTYDVPAHVLSYPLAVQ